MQVFATVLAIWLFACTFGATLIDKRYQTIIGCFVVLLMAPPLADFIAMVASSLAVLKVPKQRILLLNIAEFCAQFARVIDSFFGLIPGNPLGYPRSGHLRTLAIVLLASERTTEAEPLLVDCVRQIEKEDGVDSPRLVAYLSLLAGAQRNVGNYDASAASAERLKKIADTQNTSDCKIQAAAALADLSITYSRTGRQDEAEQVGESAMEIIFKLTPEEMGFGKEGLVAMTMNNLGCVYDDGCKYSRSAELYQRALNLKLKSLPEGDPSIAAAYSNVAFSLIVQERYESALPHLEKAVKIVEAAGLKDSKLWAEICQNQGSAYRGVQRFTEAEPLILKALQLKSKTCAVDDPSLAECYADLGRLYRDMQDFEKSNDYFHKALPIYEVRMGDKHPQVVRLLKEYCKLLQAWQKTDELEAVQARLDSIAEAQGAAAPAQQDSKENR